MTEFSETITYTIECPNKDGGGGNQGRGEKRRSALLVQDV